MYKVLETDSRLFFILFLFFVFFIGGWVGEGTIMGSLVKCEAGDFFKLSFDELLSREKLELSDFFFFLKVAMLPSCANGPSSSSDYL